MKLKIKNINKVKDASIDLNGITVIAGANGSGKSTIGKLLFSIIKAVGNAEEVKRLSTTTRLIKAVDDLYKRVKLSFGRIADEQIKELFPLPSQRMVEQLEAIKDDSVAIELYLGKLQSAINEMDLTPRVKVNFVEDLDNIKIAMDNSPAADVAVQMRSFVESEFLGKICSNGQEEAGVSLEMETPDDKLEIQFYNDLVNKVVYKSSDFLSDCTYVESPLYMHILEVLLNANTYKEFQQNKHRMSSTGMVPIHIKDLATKLDSLRFAIPNLFFNESTVDISSIVGGKVEYDKEGHKIVFREKNNGSSYSPINIASGIKTFGLIQILQQIGSINSNSFLIWDEPENHLHPRWQVKFAELLVQLSILGVPILISTHSPFFVQGIRYFTAKHNMEKYTNYYLAEEQADGFSTIQEVTDDLNAIFSKLAEPLNEIMNVDLVRREAQKES